MKGEYGNEDDRAKTQFTRPSLANDNCCKTDCSTKRPATLPFFLNKKTYFKDTYNKQRQKSKINKNF